MKDTIYDHHIAITTIQNDNFSLPGPYLLAGRYFSEGGSPLPCPYKKMSQE